jgi:succinate dehydrogenase / fumarate reductase flavoprotein subunit
LMQGLADGYFILPVTVSSFLASQKAGGVDENHPAVRQTVTEVEERIHRLLNIKGRRTPDSFHRELGALVWDQCGMARTEAGLKLALEKIPALREEFWSNLSVPGTGEELNQSLERAGRVADFLEFSELMCRDALHRNESAGGHFREEFQTDDGEAKRNDDEFSYVAAWEYTGDLSKPKLNKEPLTFEYVHPSQRSYK